MTKTSLVRLITLLLAFALVATMVTGCKKDNGDASSDTSDSVLYNDDIDDEDEDDVLVDEEEDIVNDNTSTNNKKKNNKTGGGTTGSGTLATGEKVETYERDEKATKTFFETVPASLKGKTVKHLIWWTPGKAESKKAEVFKAKTGITIKWINSGVGNHTTKLASMIGQGNSPDLAPFIQSDFPTSIINNYFQPISVGKLDLSDPIFDKETMKAYEWGGKQYGVMMKSSTMITFYPIFYNVNMFQKYGITTPTTLWKNNNWNWDTFLDTCAQFKTKGISTPLAGDYGCIYIHNSGGEDCVKIQGGNLINNCASQKVISGWQFFAKLSSTYKYVSAYSNFFSQQAPMLLTGNYIAQTGDVLDQQATAFTWDMVPTPCPKGQSTVLPGEMKMWGFPKGSKNAEAASYWLRYWLDSTMDDASAPCWTTTNKGTLTLMSWMWEQPKALFNYRSVVNYGGNYSSESMDAEFGSCGEANVKTVLDKWSGVISSNIAALKKL